MKKHKKRCLSQLGTEEELFQLSRQTIEILCVGQVSIGEATESEKKRQKYCLSQLGTEEK